MAYENNNVEAVSPKGTLIYPTLIKPDTKFDEAGVYKTKIKVPAADAQAFVELIEKVQQEELERQISEAESKKKGSGKRVKEAQLPFEEVEEDGEDFVVFNFKSKASYTDSKTKEVVQRKIPLFDSKGKGLTADLKIGTGTVARISCFVCPYYTALLGAGVTLRIRGVKIIKLVEFTGGGASAGYLGFDEDEDEGGFEADNAGFDADDVPDQDADDGDDRPNF
ncbi:hypothetical protein DBR00_02585 [Pseudomonas sp. HMWF032]|uniref:hypothetical protein n=1 Tax=Pseudomonas sp. HMWF032 TaxID=2056866 RepID=UPI000D3D6E0A|nr:hypothetical protein [Pseudomonas sp. HMWF032]PTS86461.1 hypothetical protein DBR00_02585 [Pseudomonas sp. HMWF032]PTT81350.1 hypothetical protein DBR41_16945 [Pseudomonas sp. HMWF010]